MALKGRAFLAIWHDIAEAGEAEYNIWHTRQHMPERVGVPGFLAGRRYVDWSLKDQRYFTLYETQTLETLSSDGYRARLNNPSPWSHRVQPNFLNFGRCACVLAASVGRGIGGALATFRLHLEPGTVADVEAASEPLAHWMATLDGITGAHLGVAAPDTSRIKTRESELRDKTGEDIFDAVVMVEGIGRREVEAVMAEVRTQLQTALKIVSERAAVYDLAYQIAAGE